MPTAVYSPAARAVSDSKLTRASILAALSTGTYSTLTEHSSRMVLPQELGLRPLSQLSAAHVEAILINLVTIKMIWWWSAKQNTPITNDFLWNDLMTHIGDTFLVVKAPFKNPENTQPAAENRGLSLSTDTRGVLHRSYCSCTSSTQLDGTVLV